MGIWHSVGFGISGLQNEVVVQLLSHVQLCDPVACSTPGFPVLHYLLDFAKSHVH